MKFRRHHWGILILTLLVLGGLLGYTLVSNGLFPVAWVSGTFVTLRTVEENVTVASRLYERGAIGSADEALAGVFESGPAQIFESVLESLIVSTVVRKRAPREIRAEAEERLENSLTKADLAALEATIESAYGWDLDQFRTRILEPQALEEVLREKLGEKYDEWLASERASANVKIWFVPFEWRDGALQRK